MFAWPVPSPQNETKIQRFIPILIMDFNAGSPLRDPIAYAAWRRRMGFDSPDGEGASRPVGLSSPHAQEAGLLGSPRFADRPSVDGEALRPRFLADLDASSSGNLKFERISTVFSSPSSNASAPSSVQRAEHVLYAKAEIDGLEDLHNVVGDASAPSSVQRAEHVLYAKAEIDGLEDLHNVVGVMYDEALADLYGIPPASKQSVAASPMVRCSDKGVRRYPPPLDVSENYRAQIRSGLIYDVPQQRIERHLGGFQLTANGRSAAFMVDGSPVSPLKIGPGGAFDAYPLPDGRMLVPQPSFCDCTSACEIMMLIDKGYITPTNMRRFASDLLGGRHTLEEVMESLQSHSNIEPVMVTHNLSYKKSIFGAHSSRKIAWRDLAQKIDGMGPCILSKGGHVLMLDKIREHGGNFFLTIREPFHGTYVEFRDTSKFFVDNEGPVQKPTVRAIFLPNT